MNNYKTREYIERKLTQDAGINSYYIAALLLDIRDLLQPKEEDGILGFIGKGPVRKSDFFSDYGKSQDKPTCTTCGRTKEEAVGEWRDCVDGDPHEYK